MIGVRGFFVKTEQGKGKGPDTFRPSGERIDRRALFPPAYRSTIRAGLLLFCCCGVQVHDYRKQTGDRAAGEPTLGPSFQVKASDKPTISPKIPQISADNAPNLPSQILQSSITAISCLWWIAYSLRPHWAI